MTLVDTSSWVEQLRKRGRADVRKRVEDLLRNGEAVWCAPVELELWAGVGSDHERNVLRRFAEVLPRLRVDDTVWQRAVHLADAARARGLTVPSSDILIFACAREHGAALEHADRHFEMLEKLDAAG
ncbi:MAG: PIN domain-containing protein [Candidatus Methylacidiphilales bacterium]|nr:PIN domain-containing protein [Candidatus Methylacidiphilales bacterium]